MPVEQEQNQQSAIAGIGDPIPGNMNDQFGGYQTFLPDPSTQQVAGDLNQQFDQFANQANPQLEQQIDEAGIRAEATRSQLENAGLLGLANQFRQARSAINSNVARRGTLGGSFQMGQEIQAGEAAQRGAADVTAQAASAAEQQRLAEIAPLYGFQMDLAGGSPFADLSRDLMMQDLQQRGQGAQGQFDINSSIENIRAGSEMNRAGNINSALQGLAMGVQGGITGYQNQQYMNNLRGIYGGGGGAQFGFNSGNLQNYNLPGGDILQRNPNSGVSVTL